MQMAKSWRSKGDIAPAVALALLLLFEFQLHMGLQPQTCAESWSLSVRVVIEQVNAELASIRVHTIVQRPRLNRCKMLWCLCKLVLPCNCVIFPVATCFWCNHQDGCESKLVSSIWNENIEVHKCEHHSSQSLFKRSLQLEEGYFINKLLENPEGMGLQLQLMMKYRPQSPRLLLFSLLTFHQSFRERKNTSIHYCVRFVCLRDAKKKNFQVNS